MLCNISKPPCFSGICTSQILYRETELQLGSDLLTCAWLRSLSDLPWILWSWGEMRITGCCLRTQMLINSIVCFSGAQPELPKRLEHCLKNSSLHYNWRIPLTVSTIMEIHMMLCHCNDGPPSNYIEQTRFI